MAIRTTVPPNIHFQYLLKKLVAEAMLLTSVAVGKLVLIKDTVIGIFLFLLNS